MLAKRDRNVLDISAPRDKLEGLFLRIVGEAEAERESTSGTVGTGQVAEFLRGEEDESAGQQLIEELITSDEDRAPLAEPTAAKQASPATPDPDANLLADLVSTSAPPLPSAATEPSDATPGPALADADRAVLDSLMGDDTVDDGSTGEP